MIKAVSNFTTNDANYNSAKVPSFSMNNLTKQTQTPQITFTGINGSKVGRSILGDFAHSAIGRIRRLAEEVSNTTGEFLRHLKGQDELPIAKRPLTANGTMSHPDPFGNPGVEIEIPDKNIPDKLNGKVDGQGNYYERTSDGTVKELDTLADDGISDVPSNSLTEMGDFGKVDSSLDLDSHGLGKIGADDLAPDGLAADLDAGVHDINLDSHLAELGLDSHELGLGEHVAVDAPR